MSNRPARFKRPRKNVESPATVLPVVMPAYQSIPATRSVGTYVDPEAPVVESVSTEDVFVAGRTCNSSRRYVGILASIAMMCGTDIDTLMTDAVRESRQV